MNNRSNPYGLHEGLPTPDDVDPSVIGTAKLEAGEATQTWPHFGLELVPVEMDGEDTGRRLIRRNGKFLGDVSDRYKLLPNERAVQAAEEAAAELGAVPFNKFDGDWFIELDENVFQDEDRRRAHALYAWDDPVEIGEGDPVQMGFAVHNSIDGSMSFQVGLFTFRHACANMVFMGADGQGMGFDQREVLNHSSHAHTKGLEIDVESLVERIENTVLLLDDVEQTYRDWREELLTPDEAWTIIDRMPSKDLPDWMQTAEEIIKEEEEEAAENDAAVPWERRAEIIQAETPRAETKWDTYNDMTQAVWHDNRTNDTSKIRKFQKVHSALGKPDGVK